MNKITRQLFSLGLSSVLLLSTVPMTALAASEGSVANDVTVGIDELQNAKTAYTEITPNLTEKQNSKTEVYLTVDNEDILVSVPEKVIVDGKVDTQDKLYKGAYQVKVEGDFSGDEQIVVEPSSNTVELQQKGKENIEANIEQNKTEFTYMDIINNTNTGDGLISTDKLTAGSWNGLFNFNISLESMYVYYSSLELAVADANDLTTENANVKRNDIDNAEAGLYISNGKAYIRLFKNTSNTNSFTLSENTVLNLGGYTINFNKENYITSNATLDLKNGTIHCQNALRVIHSTTSKNDLNITNIDIYNDIDNTLSHNVKGVETQSAKVNMTDNSVTIKGTAAGGISIVALSLSNENAVNRINNTNVDIKASNITRARGVQVYTSDTEFNDCTFEVAPNGNEIVTSSYYYNMYIANDNNSHNGKAVYINGGNYSVATVISETSKLTSDATGSCFDVGGRVVFQDGDSKLYVHGGNSAIRTQGVANITINSGVFGSPNHGGIYEAGSTGSVINILGGRFYNTQTANEQSVPNVFDFGGAYFGGNSVVNIKNATIEGGQYGIRIKNSEVVKPYVGADVTISDSYVSGFDYAFSVGEGKLTINQNVITDKYSKSEVQIINGELFDNR